MKFNFKKIAPILTGAILLGSTIGFAGTLAADSYPTSFSNAVVVVGDAASADTTAANDIAADLGKLTTSADVAVSDGWLVQKGSTKLFLNKDIADVTTTVDNTELPTTLISGTYKDAKGANMADYTFEQTLTFVGGGNSFNYTERAKGDSNKPVDYFLRLDKSINNYNYTVKFLTGVKFDNSTAALMTADFEDTKIKLFGEDWTVTAMAVDALKITLMGGAVSSTIKSGEKVDVVYGGKTYSVTSTVYSTKVLFNINGEAITIDDGSTGTLSDGIVIGVTDISTSSKESTVDQASFFLGAKKLVLEQGQKAELNGVDVDDSYVAIGIDATNSEIEEIEVDYQVGTDTYVPAGSSWTDPVFKAFKLVFAGVDQKTEDIVFDASGSDATLTVKNSAGITLKIPFYSNGTKVSLGGDDMSNVWLRADGMITRSGDMLTNNGDFCVGTADVTDCEGLLMLVTDTNGEARIIELSTFDLTNNKVKFTDVQTGSVTEESYTENTSKTMDVGFATIVATIYEDNFDSMAVDRWGNVSNCTWLNMSESTRPMSTVALPGVFFLNTTVNKAAAIKTSLDGWVNFTMGPFATTDNYSNDVRVWIYNGSAPSPGSLVGFNVSLNTDDEIVAVNIGNTTTLGAATSGSKIQKAVDDQSYGATVTYESEYKKDLTITYPYEAVIGKVYISPVSAAISGGGAPAIVVKDKSIGDYKKTKNLVVVGGSAINSIAAELLGLTYPTYGSSDAWTTATGASENKAIIKLFSGLDGTNKAFATGQLALLVAGYEAKDTQAAAKYLIANKAINKVLSTATTEAVVSSAI